MEKYFVICLILIEIILKINAQVPTVPTAGPTDPTTTTTTIFTIPTPSTITASTTIPSAPTLSTTTNSNLVTTTSVPSLTCPPNGISHWPTDNCQTFTVCVYGRPHIGICSDGTLFDPLSSSCLPAANVDCGTRFRP